MSKQAAAQAKQSIAPGHNRAQDRLFGRQHTLGTHLCVRRDAIGLARNNHAASAVEEVLRSPGQPLDSEMRAYMESRFACELRGQKAFPISAGISPYRLEVRPPGDMNEQEARHLAGRVVYQGSSGAPPKVTWQAPKTNYDFSPVRLHTGPRAVQSARDVDALAFTVGNNIVFGAGAYSPQTLVGKEVLAHELAHVVQQSRPGSQHFGVLHRVGLFESIARFFGGGTFSDNELKAYIEGLRGTGKIEDKIDSDNKARAVVSKGLHRKEDPGIRALLIQEMLSGYTASDDEQAILKILGDATPDDRERIVGKVGAENLVKKFSGDERDQLYMILGSVANHKKEPVDTDWSVAFTAEGGGASRPKRMALVVDQLQALPTSANTPLDVVPHGRSVVNNNPTGGPVQIPGTVALPRDTSGMGYMAFHVAVARPDNSAAEVPGLPVQAPYPTVGLDRRHFTATVDVHLGSEKVGEHQVQKGSEVEQQTAAEQTKRRTSGVQTAAGQSQTVGQRRSISGEQVLGKERQKSTSKETTETSSRTVTLTLGSKLTPELSAKLATKTGIQVDGGLLALILAVAVPEGALLAKEIGAALSSIKFSLEGSAEFGFKVSLELSAQIAASWTKSHSETVKQGTLESQKEEQHLKREVESSAGAGVSRGTVVSTGEETSISQKKSEAERQRTATSETDYLAKLTIDKADVAFGVR